jgi:hypothetical protein
VSAEEQLILDDITRQTGLVFARIGGIDTRDASIAMAVLPVLAEWIDHPLTNYRHGISSRFHTPHAKQWADLLVKAWLREEDRLVVFCLAQCLCLTIQQVQAERVFEAIVREPERLEYFGLLAKLALFPTVEQRVKDYVARALEERVLGASDVDDASRVKDPRIAALVAKLVDSPDKYVRQVAKRFVARGKKLPEWIQYTTSQPPRQAELFSTEVDVDKLTTLVRELERRFHLKLLAAAKQLRPVMARAEIDRWMVVSTTDRDEARLQLWIRLEDIDTVEVVLTRGDAETITAPAGLV